MGSLGACDRLRYPRPASGEHRDVYHHHRVDFPRLEEHRRHVLVLGRTTGGDQVDRVLGGSGRGQDTPDLLAQLRRQLRDHQAVRFQGIGGEYPGPTGVGDHPHPVTGRDRLIGEERGGVEELLDGVHPDHAGLMEQGLDRDVRRGKGSGVGRGRLAPGLGPAGLDRDDRLAPPDSTSEAGELGRVAERLDVEGDHVGLGVVLPGQDEVIAAHVCLVSHGDELRDPDVGALGIVEDGDAQRTGLARHRHIATRWVDRGKGPVELDRGRGVEQSHAVGPDHAHPGVTNDVEQLGLQLRPLLPRLRETGRDHDDATHSLRRALTGYVDDQLLGDHDVCQIDFVRDLADGGVGPDRSDHLRLGVHRVEGAGEPVEEDVVEETAADRCRVGGGPDHRHRAGKEERQQRSRNRPLLSLPLRFEQALALCHREVHGEHAFFDGPAHLVARVAEEPHHLPVLGKDECPELLDPLGPGVSGQQLEEESPDPSPLVGIGDCEGHLRGVGVARLPVVAGEPDHLAVEHGDHRHPVRVVDVGEEVDFLGLEGLLDPEEPEVPGLGAQGLEELD